MTARGKLCWLHVGAPKTGTTSLQQFLADNAEALGRSGYTYPVAGQRSGGHHDPAFLLAGGYPDWATPQPKPLDRLRAEMRQEIDGCTGDVILSSENFYLLCQPESVRDFLNDLGFEPADMVRIVVYIRRQDDAVMSWYNQAVKAQGFTGDIETHRQVSGNLWDYASRIAAWSSCFGERNLRVCLYDEHLREGDIRKDFLALLGVTPEGFHYREERVNTTINSDLLEFQRQMNRLPLSAQDKRRFHKELMALSNATAGTDLFADAAPLSYAERLELLERHEEGNRQLARRFFARSHLFSPPSRRVEGDGGVAAGLTADKLAAVIAWLMIKTASSPLHDRRDTPHG